MISRERKAIERTYEDICNIYSFAETEQNAITKLVRTLVYENVKCALSQKELKSTNQTDSENKLSYNSKLFINPDVVIKPGCEIVVMKLGRTYLFKQVGEPFVYSSHQELVGTVNQRA